MKKSSNKQLLMNKTGDEIQVDQGKIAEYVDHSWFDNSAGVDNGLWSARYTTEECQ